MDIRGIESDVRERVEEEEEPGGGGKEKEREVSFIVSPSVSQLLI